MYCPTCKETFPTGAFCAKDGTALVEAAQTSLVGQVLADRYRIVRLLGEGGMGQVYEAQHLNINKRFAIKMLRPEVIGSAQSLQRFRQEAWAASSIGHENIVEIDDFATLPSGQVYLAMEFLDGQSLAERIRDGAPLAVEEAVAVMIAVAHGLGAAHEKGIVHRDMKPENVFLARRGGRVVAKILDFGIAKMTGGDEPSNLTRTGAIFGTPLYMSPEQAKGKPADARADVYALGVMLYELLTGSVPFGGESSVEILSQHIGATPVRPTELAPERGISPALEALVLRALEKEPDARVPSMAEFAAELEKVAATLPKADLSGIVTAPPAPPTGWNAQIKTPRPNAATPTGPRPAAATPRPSATTGRPQARTPSGAVATGAAATGATPVGAAQLPSPSATATGLEPARNNGARYAVVGVLALALVGGAAWLLIPHGAKIETATPSNPKPLPLPPVPAP
ncbi:MAG TPA: protein kinase, partial [Polyangia bacterium]